MRSSPAPGPYSAETKSSLPTTIGDAAFTEAAARARHGRRKATAPVDGSRPTRPARVRKMTSLRPPTVAVTGDE